MIWTIARKELLSLLLTYRFSIGLILCVIAVSAGTLSVIEDVDARRQAYRTALEEFDEDLDGEEPLGAAVYTLYAFRAPRTLAVFSVGSDRWQGNQALVTHHQVLQGAQWLGAANPYMAVFRSIDFTLIVQVIVGLLALLFAYDAISGEREEGTLRLMLANPVARDQVLLGKALGHLLGLSAILLVCVVLCVLFVQQSPSLHLNGGELLRVGVLFLVSVLYVTAMYCSGLLLSTCTVRSATALVLAVFAWVAGVAVYPNAVAYGVDRLVSIRAEATAAGQLRSQLDDAFGEEVEALALKVLGTENTYPSFNWGTSSSDFQAVRGYIKGTFPTQEKVDEWVARMREMGMERSASATPPDEVDAKVVTFREYFGSIERLRVQYADRVWSEAFEPVERRMRAASELARKLVLLSPAGAYAQATSVLARTDRQDFWNWLSSTRQYRRNLIQHYQEQGWFDSRQWFNDQGEVKPSLAGLPRYVEHDESIVDSMGRAAQSLVLLVGFIVLTAGGAYVRFRRYDV